MAEETLMEIAYSLENCNVPFLWVLRLPHGVKEANSVLPPGFLDRVNHPSIGGFLSHCGWNSTIESICAGVPVIPRPLHGDQPLNARLLEEVTRTGMGIQRSPKGRFIRDGICTSILALMVGEKGKEIRANAAKWKEAALASQKDGGSSSLGVHDFVQGIIQFACK
ncbi:hypothetical protein R1sor_013064 [Riccia sorocarpa]|uniref:Uncharacterized protein n=1 Tax=Riccia sorocarpa TaxID=122646 RepID=A0ABD3H8R2_9MARC